MASAHDSRKRKHIEDKSTGMLAKGLLDYLYVHLGD